MYSLRQSAAMCWGKIRRAFLVAFRKGRVVEKLERRRGACTRCGACCKILFQCPAYDDSDGNPKCLIYNDRPGVCGLFPLDEKDLRERDIVMPDTKCGFYFAPPGNGNGHSNGNGNGHGHGTLPRAEAMPAPVRWGPTRANGKPKLLRGTFSILFSYFHKPNGKSNGNGNGNGNGHGNGHGNGTS